MAKSKAPVRADAASSLTDFRPIASEALSVFSPLAIRWELESLQRALELPKRPVQPDLDEQTWSEVIDDLVRTLGAVQFDLTTGYAQVSDDPELKQALAVRVQSALRAIDYATRVHDGDGSATGLLLPTSYARRIAILLGSGVLPVAWVRMLDVLRF